MALLEITVRSPASWKNARGYTAAGADSHLTDAATTFGVVKRLTGVDLGATRAFLLNQCFVAGRGFWSQYAGQGTISCTTTAICVYALAATGRLTKAQKDEFRRVLLAFRRTEAGKDAGAFPRTTGEAPSVWTTGQAVLALWSLGSPWRVLRPSIEWLLRAQTASGGWNFTGSDEGHERLLYTFYPTLVLARNRRHLGEIATQALARVASFVSSCEERHVAFWTPMREHLQLAAVSVRGRRGARRLSPRVLTSYWELFEEQWPTQHVDEDWLAQRFSMALMCGPNYLHLRRFMTPDDPLSLLHIRHLADEKIGSGWNDRHEESPKTWATALGALTLHRWAVDLARTGASLRRLPTRAELLARLRSGAEPSLVRSRDARALLRRLGELRPGQDHATRFQHWVRDVFTFLFGSQLKEPKLESKTFFGTMRRDITFRNAATGGSWFDWKMQYQIDPVLIECKNTDALSYDDLRQTASYLGKRMGRVAILVCRKTKGEDVWDMLNWFVNNDDKWVLVVNDQNLLDWIRIKDRGEDPTNAIADLYRSLREGAQ